MQKQNQEELQQKKKPSQINDVFSVSVSKKLNLSCEEISKQNTTADNHIVLIARTINNF